MTWITQRECTEVGEYELVVERQKQGWECDQKLESWKWLVVFHGTVVASGSVNDVARAKEMAMANVPADKETD